MFMNIIILKKKSPLFWNKPLLKKTENILQIVNGEQFSLGKLFHEMCIIVCFVKIASGNDTLK